MTPPKKKPKRGAEPETPGSDGDDWGDSDDEPEPTPEPTPEAE